MREPREDDKYLFISYSHKDADVVYSDLRELFDKGLRYWYDSEIGVGEDWTDDAEKSMRNNNCLGVIFYMSENLFKSSAVEKEIRIFNEISKERNERYERKESNEKFYFIPVSIGDRSVNAIIRDVYLNLADLSDESLCNTFPQERLEKIIDTFGDKKIYIHRSGLPDDHGHIIKMLEEIDNKSLFSNNECMIDVLKRKRILNDYNGELYLSFGKYPQHSEPIPVPMGRNVDIDYNGKKYRIEDETSFVFEDIKWKMISIDRYHGVFVSDLSLDMMVGGPELENWIESEFMKVAFNDDERKCIVNISLLSTEQLEKNIEKIGTTNNTDYAMRVKPMLVCIWLSEYVQPSKTIRSCCTLSGNLTSKGMAIKQKGGVRMVISINFEPMLIKEPSPDDVKTKRSICVAK